MFTESHATGEVHHDVYRQQENSRNVGEEGPKFVPGSPRLGVWLPLRLEQADEAIVAASLLFQHYYPKP